MKTKTGQRRDSYLTLIRRFPLRHIHSDEELDAATEVMFSLVDRLDNLDDGERAYLEVLTDLVEKYEQDTIPMPPVPDKDMLRHLIESKGVTQTKVAQDTGIAISTISEVLAGKRRLNRTHIGKLAAYFNVGTGVFA